MRQGIARDGHLLYPAFPYVHYRRMSAADIADYIYQQVAAGEFLILPHEAGRQAWQLKCEAPARLYDEMAEMAVKMRAKAPAR